MKEKIIAAIKQALPSAVITTIEENRTWFFIETNESGALRTLQDTFARVEVSIIRKTKFGVPLDSVEI